MSTQLNLLRDALAVLLTSDPAFSAAVNTLLGVTSVQAIKTNMPVAQIAPGMYPCWILELGDMQAASLTNDDGAAQTIGLSQQGMVQEWPCALMWAENDRDRAAIARAELPYLMTQLFLNNSQPGGLVASLGITFIGAQPDRGANHPTQIWRFTLQSLHAFPANG